MASQYVEQLRQESIRRYDDEMALRAFRAKFKPQIENQGLTEEQFKQSHRYNDDDLQMFRKIAEEVKTEAAIGAAFLEGFTNPDFMRDMRNKTKKED